MGHIADVTIFRKKLQFLGLIKTAWVRLIVRAYGSNCASGTFGSAGAQVYTLDKFGGDWGIQPPFLFENGVECALNFLCLSGQEMKGTYSRSIYPHLKRSSNPFPPKEILGKFLSFATLLKFHAFPASEFHRGSTPLKKNISVSHGWHEKWDLRCLFVFWHHGFFMTNN